MATGGGRAAWPAAGATAPRRETGRTRRALLRLAVAAAASSALAACAGPEAERGRRSGKVQLVYQDWRTDWYPALARELLEQFHATHPSIRVFYTPDPDGVEEKMLAVMQAGTAPDVFTGCCTHFPIWAQRGYALDLRPYVRADLDGETIADWDPAQYRALATVEGRQFGLPKYHGALALYFNRDLFDELGIPHPDASWGYGEYLWAMQSLSRDRDRDGQRDVWGSLLDVSWERLQVHVNAWGGHFVAPQDPTRCRMAEPEALAALEWLRARMWSDRVMATLQDVRKMSTRQAFAAGRVAMVEDGSWALKDILATAGFRVGVAPFPAGPVRRATLATTDGFGIYAGTRHPDAAWELVRFLVGKDAGRAMARAHFLQPARASLVDEWAAFVRQEFPEKARELDVAAFAHGHVNGYSVTAEIFARNMAEAKRLSYAAWDRIFVLGQGSPDLLREVCRQINQPSQRARRPAARPASGTG